jgi:hypothetical protein
VGDKLLKNLHIAMIKSFQSFNFISSFSKNIASGFVCAKLSSLAKLTQPSSSSIL